MTTPNQPVPLVLKGQEGRSLHEALADLQRVSEEALEEGFSAPAQTMLSNAERVLKEMFKIQPQRFEVYPMPEGQIAIDVPNQRGSSVIVLCEPDGGALCSVNIRGEYRRKRYISVAELPDEFLRAALVDVAHAS